MRFFKKLFVGVVVALCFCSGCSKGPEKPQGFPELFPCQITITQGGSPLESAHVVLFPKTGRSNGWSTEGLTDANGVAEMKTHADFKGAPAGDYIVRVSKIALSPSDLPATEPTDPVEYEKWYNARQLEKRIKYRLVKAEFDDMTKTPLAITIASGKNEAIFDVGEPIQEAIK